MRSRRGFSLIELLFALAILALVITTSLVIFTERQRRLQQASETILAWQALSNETEAWRRVNFGSLETAQTTPPEFLSDTTILGPLKPFTAKATIATKTPTIKTVTMLITWRNGERKASLVISRVDTGGGNLW